MDSTFDHGLTVVVTLTKLFNLLKVQANYELEFVVKTVQDLHARMQFNAFLA